MKSADLGDLFSEEWTREAISRVVEKGQIHLTQVRVSCFYAFMLELTMIELFTVGYPTGLGA